MDEKYFESIEINYQFYNGCKTNIIYTRNNHYIYGIPMEKNGCSHIPSDTMERMIDGTHKKYTKTLNNIIKCVDKFKINKLNEVKYQTLGCKQAKEIKKYCELNGVGCQIIQDDKLERKKLTSIGIWHDKDKNQYDTDTRDYGREYLDFHYSRQKVVYVKLNK